MTTAGSPVTKPGTCARLVMAKDGTAAVSERHALDERRVAIAYSRPRRTAAIKYWREIIIIIIIIIISTDGALRMRISSEEVACDGEEEGAMDEGRKRENEQRQLRN
jgi:hypothetical protein